MSLWSHTPLRATLGSFSKTRGYLGVLCMHGTHFARCQPGVSQSARSAYPLPSPHPCLGSHLGLLLRSSTVCMLPAGRLCTLHLLKKPQGAVWPDQSSVYHQEGRFQPPPSALWLPPLRTWQRSGAAAGAVRSPQDHQRSSSAQFGPFQASSAQPSSAQPRGGAGRPPPRSRRRRNPLGGGGRRSRHHEPDGDRVAPGAVPVL